jgi:hypothetical protein
VILLGWVFAIFIKKIWINNNILSQIPWQKFCWKTMKRKSKKSPRITHNCLQHDRVLRILLLLYFKYCKIWLNVLMDYLPLEQHHKIEKENHIHTLYIGEEYIYSNIWVLLAICFFWAKFAKWHIYIYIYIYSVNWVLLEFYSRQTLKKKLTGFYPKFQHIAKNIERY